MKIAIHHRKGSFSDRWIEYCRSNSIQYKLVNAFDSNIIEQVRGYDVFMWHHHHVILADVLVAKQILFALEHAGVRVFPDFRTGWHFDDKVAQKYLLEAIDVPLIPSYVFYDKQSALDWVRNTTFPKVFKLRGGSGSAHVKLVKNKSQCISLIDTAFGKGFKQFDGKEHFLDSIKKYRSGVKTLPDVFKSFGRMLISTDFGKHAGYDKGYIYFQDFIPGNRFDVRIVVVGGSKAAGEKRFVRKNDFRASGSGEFSYDGINIEAVRLAFDISKRLNLQSCAFDFVFDEQSNPLVVELSYGFGTAGVSKAPGYWDSDLQWHEGTFNLHDWMIDIMIK